MPTGELECNSPGASGERIGSGVEAELAGRGALEDAAGDCPDRGDQGTGPRTEDDQRRDLHCARKAQPVRLDRTAGALPIRVLEQRDQDRGSQKQRKGRVAHTRPYRPHRPLRLVGAAESAP